MVNLNPKNSQTASSLRKMQAVSHCWIEIFNGWDQKQASAVLPQKGRAGWENKQHRVGCLGGMIYEAAEWLFIQSTTIIRYCLNISFKKFIV